MRYMVIVQIVPDQDPQQFPKIDIRFYGSYGIPYH